MFDALAESIPDRLLVFIKGSVQHGAAGEQADIYVVRGCLQAVSDSWMIFPTLIIALQSFTDF